ncbi:MULTISPECIES: tyrosine-type recombinase/integrase [Variovorax]|uniref:tyrosine-type recombinase/integrase n=1 Tax=Variovorax sp. DAIF25 TaxID=3080983 RepID=UPI003D6C47A6
MLLVFSTRDYKLARREVPGFPILLNSDMSSCYEANEFFRFYLQRAAIESRKSWGPIAQSIYDYFGFLEAHELSWTDVDRGEDKNLLAAYRDYSFDVAKQRRNTIRLRLTYICEFYKYALRRNWIDVLPQTYEKRHVTQVASGFLAHLSGTDGTVETNSAMPRKHKDLVKFLSIQQARQLLQAATNEHHKALMRLALSTGLRREELATFPLAYVFDPDQKKLKDANVAVTLDPEDGTGMRTKGSKRRVIYMARDVMKGLKRYADHLRGERASLCADQHASLFLNQYGRPFAQDGKAIEAIVRKIGQRIGVPIHPHMLRHTYATHTLSSLQRRGGRGRRTEPLVFLQQQLGHASLSTTMVYLHMVNDVADEAVLAYDAEICSWDEE